MTTYFQKPIDMPRTAIGLPVRHPQLRRFLPGKDIRYYVVLWCVDGRVKCVMTDDDMGYARVVGLSLYYRNRLAASNHVVVFEYFRNYVFPDQRCDEAFF